MMFEMQKFVSRPKTVSAVQWKYGMGCGCINLADYPRSIQSAYERTFNREDGSICVDLTRPDISHTFSVVAKLGDWLVHSSDGCLIAVLSAAKFNAAYMPIRTTTPFRNQGKKCQIVVASDAARVVEALNNGDDVFVDMARPRATTDEPRSPSRLRVTHTKTMNEQLYFCAEFCGDIILLAFDSPIVSRWWIYPKITP